MAKEKEILEYQLDISDVEAKAQRIKELSQEISAKRGRGEDTSGLELGLGREIDLMGRLSRKEKETAGATQDLVRQKDKLANVVGLLGGQFGGVVGQLGSVVELLTLAGPAAAGMAAGVAGFTALVVGVREYKRALEEAEKALTSLDEAQKKMVDEQQSRADQIEHTLLGMGALSVEAAKAADAFVSKMQQAMRVPEAMAMAVGPQAYVAGISPENAALLALSAHGPGGQIPATAADAKAVMEEILARPEHVEQLKAQLAALPGTGIGARSARDARAAAYMAETYPERAAGLHGPGPDALLLEIAKEMGLIKGRAGPERIRELLNELRAMRIELDEIEVAAAVAPVEEYPLRGAPAEPGRAELLRKRIQLFEELEQAHERLGDIGTKGGGPAPVYSQTFIETQASSIYNTTPNKKKVASNHGAHSPGEAARWKLPR